MVICSNYDVTKITSTSRGTLNETVRKIITEIKVIGQEKVQKEVYQGITEQLNKSHDLTTIDDPTQDNCLLQVGN